MSSTHSRIISWHHRSSPVDMCVDMAVLTSCRQGIRAHSAHQEVRQMVQGAQRHCSVCIPRVLPLQASFTRPLLQRVPVLCGQAPAAVLDQQRALQASDAAQSLGHLPFAIASLRLHVWMPLPLHCRSCWSACSAHSLSPSACQVTQQHVAPAAAALELSVHSIPGHLFLHRANQLPAF